MPGMQAVEHDEVGAPGLDDGNTVVVAHGFNFLMPHLPWWCGFLGHSGFYGVELFFALSGFLIGNLLIRTGSALAQPDRLVTFYIRRWFRTLPLFWLLSGFKFYSN
jgi:peptidoglycan/LPS O-acetylase OafA/YrhL